jgi:crotonobetaine/carnitine-CoA ligase
MPEDELHDYNRWVFGDVLARQAERYGDRTWIRMVGGDSLSFSAAHRTANQVGRLLLDTGVSTGDALAVMMPNSLEHCFAWFGITRIGAVLVAVNTDYKGAFLSHVLNNSKATHIIIHSRYLDRLAELLDELPYLTQVILVGEHPAVQDLEPRCPVTRFESFSRYSGDNLNIPVSYRDPACVMYTSGTTGPSKGVIMPHAHVYLFGLGTIENMLLTGADVFYIVLPLFHANAMFMQLYATLIAGAVAVIRERFSASRWIHDVVDYDVTITNSLGVVISFVLNREPSPLDKQNRLRAIGIAPNLPELDSQLRERFDIQDVFGLYGMTEVNIPLYTRPGDVRPGSCGRLWERYYELQIVDAETDMPLPAGEIGEIVIRPKLPFGFMSGYLNMPEQTVEAWRNFWFHTGDAATMDEHGYVYFVDRIKDCIRRRGENISSFEIEQVIAAHPAVAEIAAVAVKSEITGGEDEVKVVIVSNQELNIDALYEYCEQSLPRFAVPRYVELVDSLPKTPTGKVRKTRLRELGITPATLDREKD